MARRSLPLREAAPVLGRTVRRFRPHLRQQRLLLVLGLLCLLVEVGLRLVEPWPLAYVIDSLAAAAGADTVGRGSGQGLQAVLVIGAVSLLGVVALRAAASYGMTVLFALAGNRVLTRVRGELYDHLNTLSMRFHQSARTGDLVTRVTGDVGRLQDAVVTALLPLFGNVITLLGMVVVITIMDWQLALVVLLVLPLFALLSGRSTGRIMSVSRRQRSAEGALASLATETLGSMKVVKSYSLESRMGERFAGGNQRALKDSVRAKRLSAGLERSTDVLVGLATATVLFFGANRVLSGDLSIGELTVFLAYLKTAFRPLRDLAKYTGRLSKAAASGERITALLDENPDIRDSSWARPARPFRGDLRLDHVTVSYGAGRPALQDVSLAIRPGERVALVGSSGAGKSTVATMLTRMRDPDEGRVLIDGHDLRDLTVDSVRQQISIVLQESVLFAGTVADNIAYGLGREVTRAQIEAAARTAGADEFVRALPDGYDTELSERGDGLSGGQRQRIAIARAAIREAPIVILDEALTGLDPDTEAEVIAALDRLTADRTTIVITHDMEVAARSDRVVRIEEGRVVADSRRARSSTGAGGAG